jgi:hypothetical protein
VKGGGDKDKNARRRNAARMLTIDKRRRAASITNRVVRGGNNRCHCPVVSLQMAIHHHSTMITRVRDNITKQKKRDVKQAYATMSAEGKEKKTSNGGWWKSTRRPSVMRKT